ncbi:MerR family transcriptional regulator [Microbacterium sp. R1]|nr:MerR family transcriptional regulator [Microbacterium sp. R1]
MMTVSSTKAQTLRIGEVAALVGVTPRVLRAYEEQGLLDAERGSNGYRVYRPTGITRAANIKALIDVGLTSEDIRSYLEAGCLDVPRAPPSSSSQG